jgi:sulfite reductase alpha subunit-like flavoprotein
LAALRDAVDDRMASGQTSIKLSISSLDAIGSAVFTSSRRQSLVKRFTEDVHVCVNPPDIATILRKRHVVFLPTPREDGGDNIGLVLDALRDSTANLTGIVYAICTCQDKRAKNQSRLPFHLDAALTALGATRVVRPIEIDIGAEDQGEAVFQRWTLAVCTTLGLPMPELAVSAVIRLRPIKDEPVVANPRRPRTFEIARLRGAVELCPPSCGLTITKYSIKLPEGLGYRTGNRIVTFRETRQKPRQQ